MNENKELQDISSGQGRQLKESETDDLLTVPEAARRLRHSTKWVRQRVKSGDLHAYKLDGENGRILVPEASIAHFLQRHVASERTE
jgi:excisionase family DNA binding protein